MAVGKEVKARPIITIRYIILLQLSDMRREVISPHI
jgi:hypothetical protein